ncbi:JAB domain-containing protein [Pseudomonas sp. SMV7]|uniref:JAB domain-containing protein n=1 Tax=Pseudomonas sp. SMV7 TaxID=3390194 RepID=UPI003F82F46F
MSIAPSRLKHLFSGPLKTRCINLLQIIKSAMEYDSTTAIVAHYQPTDSFDHSHLYCSITQGIKKALELIGIQMVVTPKQLTITAHL